MTRAWAVIVLTLAATGCASRRLGSSDPDADQMRAANRLFEARGADPAKLGAAIDAWMAIGVPDNPDVLARLSRAWWVRSLAEPEAARAHLETGEELGWACLLTFPAFEASAGVAGFHVPTEAVATLGREAVPCLVWTVVNGLDLVELRGPGAALELGSLGPLVRRIRTLAPAAEAGFGAWAAARYRVATAQDAERDEARGMFEEAIAASPNMLLFRTSYAEAFPDVRNAVLPGPARPDPDPFAIENGSAKYGSAER